ncbi:MULTISPECIES: hypothetical protein [unclassified Microcoleus]
MRYRSALLTSDKGGSDSGRSTKLGQCELLLAIASSSANLATTQY